MMKIKDFNLKNPLVIVIAILLITDIAILTDIQVLRQTFGFLCFTILPGLLIIHALKLDKIGFLKKFLLSVGLSISFLMFFGLFINTLYPLIGILRPLSTVSLVISLNFALIFLLLVGYKRNRGNSDFLIFNIRTIKDYYIGEINNDSLISPLLFPILFPFLSIFGTHLMNTEGNNIILMIMLFLIPIYVAFVIYLNKRIQKIVYPVAILMISISLLLMHGLRSSYVNGADVHNEYYAFQVVAGNAFWSMSNCHSVLTACLSTSLLPAIYQGLLNMNGQYIYKLVYQLIFSITPLAVYVLSKKYVNELYAFIAAIFFTSQSNFFYVIQSAMRTEIALLFFALAMMVFFDDELDKLNKKIFFLIFMFSVVVSHYTIAYVFLFLLLSVWLILTPLKDFFKSKNQVTFSIVALLSVITFFWYAQVTETSFAYSTAVFFKDTANNMIEWFFDDIKAEVTITTFGIKAEEIPGWITDTKAVICNTANALVSIGAIGSIVKYVKYREGEIEHLLMTAVSWALMVMIVVMPYVYSYELGRLYMQALIFLALSFVTGGKFVATGVYNVFCKIKDSKDSFGNPEGIRHVSISKYALLIVMVVLIPYFACNTYFFYQILGVPYSEDLNTHGIQHSKFYISDGDVIGAKWLCNNVASNSSMPINVDIYGGLSLRLGFDKPARAPIIANETISMGYIYLRNANVVEDVIYTSVGKAKVSECRYLFVGKSKIYGNGISEVYL